METAESPENFSWGFFLRINKTQIWQILYNKPFQAFLNTWEGYDNETEKSPFEINRKGFFIKLNSII